MRAGARAENCWVATFLAAFLLTLPSAALGIGGLCQDLSSPSECVKLSGGVDYTYDVEFRGIDPGNQPGAIMDWRGTAEFLGFPNGEGEFADYWLLVLVGCTHTTAPPPPLADADYLPDSFRFVEGAAVPTMIVTDGSPGQINDAVGNLFLALILPVETGTVFEFNYQIRLNEVAPNPSEFTQWVTAFLPVPEPGALGLLALGLSGLALIARRRGDRA